MAVDIKMPQLSDTMNSGRILHWHKMEGDAVACGDILAEVETDKANLELEASQAGTLVKILAPAGAEARVGETVAWIGSAGEKIAVQKHPAGEQISAAPALQEPRAFTSESGVPGKLVPYTRMRSAIARRMLESSRQSPHFFTTAAVNMQDAQKLREALKKKAEFKGLGINHMIIKAAAYALTREPSVNCAARNELRFVPEQINIGVVSAVDDGLLIPVLHGVDRLSLQDLVAEARAVIERTKAGKPTSADLRGGTFTVSNMGMFDIENFTALISPGQGAILSIGAMQDQPIVENGRITIAAMMRATLAVDHRVIDGVMSAKFLQHFKEALETPALLLV
jgi:pyruvate dehydrogenase E2 component (dihydrolipoamide acetyltransferase)